MMKQQKLELKLVKQFQLKDKHFKLNFEIKIPHIFGFFF